MGGFGSVVAALRRGGGDGGDPCFSRIAVDDEKMVPRMRTRVL